MGVKVYGTSDDLVEIEGDIREEFYSLAGADTPVYLAFSDGTILAVDYSYEGIWRITPIYLGAGELKITQAVAANLDSDYSDVADLYGDINWVVVGDRVELKGR
jgi:hypothetical protein